MEIPIPIFQFQIWWVFIYVGGGDCRFQFPIPKGGIN
jgi:hypothetical protein